MASPEDDKDLLESLRALEAKTRAECPVCGVARGFTSDLVPYALVPVGDESAQLEGHGRPLFAFVCTNCGFVRLHHKHQLESP
jgi:predicted RNA-binding Zn-ribbon protein involved in translation (DUF1610 family)